MSILVLAAAVAAWAAIHSWLASSSMKELARRTLGENAARAYRLGYNIFSVISFLPVAGLIGALPDRPFYVIPAPWMWALLFGQAVAALLLLLTLLQTSTMHFAGIAQLTGPEKRQALNTSGFYRIVRHPLYLFGLVILWFTPVMTLNLLTAYAALTVYLFVGATLEEKRLVAEFGVEYLKYRSRTPMIIPRWSRKRLRTSERAKDTPTGN